MQVQITCEPEIPRQFISRPNTGYKNYTLYGYKLSYLLSHYATKGDSCNNRVRRVNLG